jgi:hypothetical protein
MEELQWMMTSGVTNFQLTSTFEPLIAQVKNTIHGKRRLTAQEVAEEAGISIGSCHINLL